MDSIGIIQGKCWEFFEFEVAKSSLGGTGYT